MNPAPASTPDKGLVHAIEVAGSQSALGRLIKRNQSTINDWLQGGKPLPAEYVLSLEQKTGISRHDLRPDIYPREPGAHAEDRASAHAGSAIQ